ncbi:MAG: biotin/lipoate A/B protein ligase family protein [Nitrososphaerales archaeon]
MWRLIYTELENPYLNLALEEALARRVSCNNALPTIRIWRNQSSVILGRFQHPLLEVDLEKCKKYNIPIVRRFTGGGTVYHDMGNINISLAIKSDFSYIKRKFIEAFAFGMQKLGLKPIIKDQRIEIDNKKISGFASALKWHTCLVHGTILFNTNLRMMEELLINPKSSLRYVRSNHTSVINLSSKVKVSLEEVLQVMILSIESTFNEKLIERELDNEDQTLVKSLYEKKYSLPEWNLGDPFLFKEQI